MTDDTAAIESTKDTVEVVLGTRWLRDREERDLPTGDVVAKRGTSRLVRLSRVDATEMLADLVHYAEEGMDECPIALVRSARMNLPKLLAALNAKP